MFVVETSSADGPPGTRPFVARAERVVVLVSERGGKGAVMPRSGWDSRVVYAVETALAEDWFCAEDSAEIEIELQGGTDEDS